MQPNTEKIVLVFQGGGALGAYQAGAYEELQRAGLEPDWVAGISIGAVNAALIAGNPPERRVPQLKAFWDMVSSGLQAKPLPGGEIARMLFNETSAGFVTLYGIPGFFMPRMLMPFMHPPGTTDALSFYDTSPLRTTLGDLVDFEHLNDDASPRLSLGAVNVRTGNFTYFDTHDMTVTPDHVMASGALPPGFPPVQIDGEAYWDGGLVSNTPLQYVLDDGGLQEDLCVFQFDLFPARGALPRTIMDVTQREKDIRYSSRTRMNTDRFRELQTLRQMIRRLVSKLPPELSADPDVARLKALSSDVAVTIVHLIHRSASYLTQSKDYEFSRASIDEHWLAGRNDVRRTLRHPSWRSRGRPDDGVLVLDLTND
ncbi:MAG: patatin-like phospholipase family protein [Hyphomicrobiaceae bacterium]